MGLHFEQQLLEVLDRCVIKAHLLNFRLDVVLQDHVSLFDVILVVQSHSRLLRAHEACCKIYSGGFEIILPFLIWDPFIARILYQYIFEYVFEGSGDH